ncbi:MAG: zinc ribbon domain-containing protein [Thiomonas sp.]|uniref:FmdB family zinc ribbon protein n=1 Tax=Thiomonas sp. TaxID=2047785 RepID=UPI002A36BDF8|nr:zinc ribbon domain-containing protein [Thiomonas sp.]MDY0329807.1 zinc ribbon domain-containing protein [Thiomonas sp.]
MPIYDYRCKTCDRRFELLVRSSTAPQCPHCGSTELDKCVTAPAAPGRSKALIASARKQARQEGHFSNYSAAEKRRLGGK